MSALAWQVGMRELGGDHWRVELQVEASHPRTHPDAVTVAALTEDGEPVARVESVLGGADPGSLSVVLALASGARVERLQLRGEDGWAADVALGTAPLEPAPAQAHEHAAQAELDYRARDYEGLLRMLTGMLAGRIGSELQLHPVAEMTALVELLAYLGDALSYSQDGVATEAYLASARRRVSVTRHAALLDYSVFEGRSARVWVQLEVSAAMRLEAGTQLLSRVPGLPARIPPQLLASALQAGALVFETCEPVELAPRAPLELDRRRQPDGRLAPGATSAVVRLDGTPPAAGSLATVGPAGDAPPGPAHIVMLLGARQLEEGTLLEWSEQDALTPEVAATRPLCVRPGNLVVADHGRTRGWQALDLNEGRTRPWPLLRHRDPSMVLGRRAARGGASGAGALLQPPEASVLPAVELRERVAGDLRAWSQRGSLLSSGPLSRDYVVELEEDRSARLRFGDGEHGLAPARHARLAVRMRTGSGSTGALGAGTLAHVVSADPRLLGACNPAPSVGAADPEPLSSVRLSAPRAFRRTRRALTVEDLVAAALAVPGVSDATAAIIESGSGPLARVRIAGASPRTKLGALVFRVRAAIEALQPIGVGLDVAGARFLAVAIEAEITLQPGWGLAAMSSAVDGLVRGALLQPGRWRFGGALHRSEVIALLAGSQGVLDVELLRFGWARSDPSAPALESLQPPFGSILRIDDAPQEPEHGWFAFRLRSTA